MPAPKSSSSKQVVSPVVCAFCQEEGNCSNNLGDLFGPHYASTLELIKQSAKMEEGKETYIDDHVRSMSSSDVREIRVDRDKKICYLTVPKTLGIPPPHNPKDDVYRRNSNSVQATERQINNDSVNMRFVQTVDYLLPAQKRSNAHQKEDPRVPGFNGKITITGTDSDGKYITIDDCTSEELNSALSETQVIVFVQFQATDKSTPLAIRVQNNALWVHAKCAEFAPDVFCIGNNVYGLYDAVRCSSEVRCTACNQPGANIPSTTLSSTVYHYPCAKIVGVDGI